MSSTPPPFDQEPKADVEVDLSSNENTNSNKISADENDLFFSTISDPNLMEKVFCLYSALFSIWFTFLF